MTTIALKKVAPLSMSALLITLDSCIDKGFELINGISEIVLVDVFKKPEKKELFFLIFFLL